MIEEIDDMKRSMKATAITLGIAGTLGLSACGGGDMDKNAGAAAPQTQTQSQAPSMSESSPATEMPAQGGAMNAGAMFGPACDKIPASGAGSAKGMAQDPVATAASHNPLLTTLVGAVGKAGLVDTLNSAKDITVFAPANSAFAKMDKAMLNKAMMDKKMLTGVLSYHVVPGRITPDKLAGSHQTLAGKPLMISGNAADAMVGKGKAKILCGNVQTANATVYLVDSVLMP